MNGTQTGNYANCPILAEGTVEYITLCNIQTCFLILTDSPNSEEHMQPQ